MTLFGDAIWKVSRKVGTLFGINPATLGITREAEKSKAGIMEREKKAGIERNFGNAYNTAEWVKKHGKGKGRRGIKKQNGNQKILPHHDIA